MATINPTFTGFPSTLMERRCNLVTWETLTSTNAVGAAIQMGGFADRTVHITGTFGSATVVIQGSNNGTDWVTLADPQGNALSKTAAAIESILELTRYLRVSTSGGDGTQDIDVLLFMRAS